MSFFACFSWSLICFPSAAYFSGFRLVSVSAAAAFPSSSTKICLLCNPVAIYWASEIICFLLEGAASACYLGCKPQATSGFDRCNGPCSEAHAQEPEGIMEGDSCPVLQSSSFWKIQGWYKVHPWSSLSRGPLLQQENSLAATPLKILKAVLKILKTLDGNRWKSSLLSNSFKCMQCSCYMGITAAWAVELSFLDFHQLLLPGLVSTVLETEEVRLYHDG